MCAHDGEPPASENRAPDLMPEDRPGFNERKVFAGVLETRLELDGPEQLGPGIMWARFHGKIVAALPISPFVQLVIASDLRSGVSYIN